MDHAVRRAVRELVTEVGYAGLTVDAVAARAGVGKAAIYRRHASRVEMVFASLVHGGTPEPLEDTGSLLGDLTVLAHRIVAALGDPAVAAAAPGLLADLAGRPEVAERFQRTFLAGELVEVRALLARAAARGEVRDGVEPEMVHAVALGTVFGWLFLLRHAPDVDLAGRLAAFMTEAIRDRPGPRKRAAPRR